MQMKQQLLLGVLVLAFGTTAAMADEMGTIRVSSFFGTIEAGRTTTNTISYDDNGLVIQIDAQIHGDRPGTLRRTFTYNSHNQVSKIVDQMGAHSSESTFTYGEVGTRLLNVQVTASSGHSTAKTFSYGDDDRVTGMVSEFSGPGNMNRTEVHTISYDDIGRVTGTEFTTEGDTGGYSVTYDEDGRPVSYVKKPFFGPEYAGTITYTPTEIIMRTGDTGGAEEITHTFEPGPCRIPKITDGVIILGMFESPIGFYADGACRK